MLKWVSSIPVGVHGRVNSPREIMNGSVDGLRLEQAADFSSLRVDINVDVPRRCGKTRDSLDVGCKRIEVAGANC